MPETDFKDHLLQEKPHLSEKEILSEIKILEYKLHLLSFVEFASKKMSELGNFSGVKYAYSQDPQLRLPEDAKARILQLRDSFNEKLWNWNVGIKSNSGDTGAAIAWLVGQGVILDFPEFSDSPPEENLAGNPRIVSEGKIVYAEIGCFFRKDNTNLSSDDSEGQPEVIYTVLKINLDKSLVTTLIKQVSDQNLFYKELLAKQESTELY